MYKITFKLLSPICFVDRPIFDGIIAYAYAKENLKEKFYQKLNIDDIIDFSKMPIKMHQKGYFISSQMFFDENINFIGSWKKRWESKYDFLVGDKSRKIRTSQGYFKSFNIPLNLFSIPEVYFYFDTYNLEEIKFLIDKHIAFLGKKGSQGYGLIDYYEIEISNIDFENNILRPIPKKFVNLNDIKDYSIKFTAWKPPYWLPDNFDECVVPKEI